MGEPSTCWISSRQLELQRQLEQAFECREQRDFFLFQSQWVHRYGLSSLPYSLEHQTTLPESGTYSIKAIASEESTQPQIEPLDASPELVDVPMPMERFAALVKDCLDEVSSNFQDNPEKTREIIPSENFRESEMASPPPLPALNHLRRWLPL